MNHIDLYKNPNLINWRTPIVIDFETYYDKDYSLKKITTEKYIRCDKFECIGLSIKIGDMPSKFYKRETGLGILQVILTETYPTSPVVCLNASFDMGILGLRYNIHPNFMVDVGVMAKLCGLDRVAKGGSLSALAKFLQSRGTITQEKGTEVHNMIGVHADDMSPEQWVAYGNYCNLDVDLTYDLYKYMINNVPISELIMADITTRMWTNPLIDLDVPLLQAYNARLLQEKQQMLANLAPTLGYNDADTLLSALRSKTEFPKILGKFVEVPTKWSEKQQCTVFATAKTDTAFTALLEHEDLRVQAIVEAKLGVSSNIEETRSGRFLDIATRGLMPIPLRYASAHTGRYGGCFTGDTKVLCLTAEQCIIEKNIVDVLLSDLVWDGEEWCEHSGVEFNGYQEVITYDGLTGTKNHRVFINETTETTLFEAMRTRTPIMDCKLPPNWQGQNTSVGEP